MQYQSNRNNISVDLWVNVLIYLLNEVKTVLETSQELFQFLLTPSVLQIIDFF